MASANDLGELKRKSVRGGATTAISQVISFGLNFISTIVLARVLGAAEYGTVGMVTAITAFAGLFRDLGLSSSTVQREKLTHAQLSTIFWVNVSIGFTLTALVAAASPLVARFYGKPELATITLWLSLSFFISSFSTQQSALLARQMKFGRRAVATLSGSAITLVTSVTLALCGFSYWSLVFGSLAGAVATTLMLNTFSGWRPGRPVRGSGVRSMLKYGANITGFDIANYFHRNMDNIVVGRYCGADALGLYGRAYQLLMFPITNLRAPINAVAFPAMSRLQHSPKDFLAYYKRVTSLLAFASMPLTAFLFIAATPVVGLVLGARWLPMVPIFSVLAITSFIQPCSSLTGLVLLSSGRSKRFFHIGVVNTIIHVAGFFIGVKWGPVGVAASYAITSYLTMFPTMIWTFSGTSIAVSDFIDAVALPAVASVLAAAVAFMALHHLSTLKNIMQVILTGVIFVSVYTGIYLTLPSGRSWLKFCLKTALSLRASRSLRVAA